MADAEQGGSLMKYSYVPDVISTKSPLVARAYDKERSKPGWLDQDPQELAALPFGSYLLDAWLPAVELDMEPTTFLGYQGSVVNHIVPALGEVPVQELTRESIKHFYAQLLTTELPGRARPMARSSVEHTHATIHRALQALVEIGAINRNPAAGARPRRRKMDQYEITTWTPDELEHFLEMTKGDRLGPLWRLLAWTGMRRGESLGLRWADVRFDVGLVAVRRALNEAGRKIYLSTPKSSQARVLELDGVTAEVLRGLKGRMDLEQDRFGRPRIRGADFVFINEEREPYKPNHITQAFRRIVDKSDLPRIRLHDLRHTHASHLIESGANPKVVQERLGHADVVITLNIYSHLFPTTQRSAVDGLTDFYRRARVS
jgi:integrase